MILTVFLNSFGYFITRIYIVFTSHLSVTNNKDNQLHVTITVY